MASFFRAPSQTPAVPAPAPHAYGTGLWLFQVGRRALLAAALVGGMAGPGLAAAGPLRIVALGDSLTAGYQLPADAAFPVVLQKALRDGGLAVDIANAGVSGDTAQAGLDRLDWSVPEGTQGVILELGANDMLRGLDPAGTAQTLQTIVTRLKGRGIRVFLAGMLAAPSLGPDYGERFAAIYPALAKTNDLPLYPFFLAGVSDGARTMRLADGMHPTAAGVDRIVQGILPAIRDWLRTFPPQG